MERMQKEIRGERFLRAWVYCDERNAQL